MKTIKMMKIAGVVAATLGCAVASAHHSVASFDRANPEAVSGVVKDFKWTNPHSWITLMVPDGKGGEEEWDLEGGSVNMLVRSGWTTKTLQPGMKVKLMVAPRKDGKIGGEWLRVLELDGQPFEVKPLQ
ncbi:MAG TPA: DUF6152 family protein [Steroidobacteraceae bacterium]|nr:DUF6152 family protein [Steroidobacteraceae bacterium]